MTLRYSNTGWITVLPAQPLLNVGWEAQVLAPEDWSTTLARITRFSALSLSVVANEFGYGSVSIPAEDRVFTDPLPLGWSGSILDREALWKIYENGEFRGEFLGQLVEEDIVSERGESFTQVSGQGTEVVLSWGKMIPQTVTLPVEEGGAVSFVPQEFLDQPAVNAILWFIEHVQARGIIPFVNLMFDAEQDSKGQPWSDKSDVIISPGENPLSLLQRLSESLGWEFRMLEGFNLFLAQNGIGIHRETDVKVFIGGDQREHTRKSSTREVVTDVYATASDGTVARATGSSDATPHKRESWVQAGDAGGITGASRVANATLTLYKDKRVGRTVQVITNRPGRIPFTDFSLEDWISVEDEKFRTYPVKVTGIAVKVDDAAQVTYELQIQTKFEAASVELAKIAAKMGGTTLAGSSTSSIQIEQVAATRLKITSLSDVGTGQSDRDALLWDETEQKWLPGVPGARTLTELDNVDTSSIPATGDVVLGYDRGTGLWVPALDDSGTGGGGGSFAGAWVSGTYTVGTMVTHEGGLFVLVLDGGGTLEPGTAGWAWVKVGDVSIDPSTVDPASFSGLALWLDAESLAGLTDGSPVASWPDSSGLNRDAYQTDPARQPLFYSGQVNGRAAVRFDGSNDRMHANGPNNGATERTLLAVVKGSGSAVIMFAGSAVSGEYGTVYVQRNSNGTLGLAKEGGGYSLSGSGVVSTDWNVVAFRRTSSGFELRVNGSPYLSGALTSETARTSVTIGAHGGLYSAGFWLGDYAEILFYEDDIGTGNLESLEAWAMARYGVTS